MKKMYKRTTAIAASALMLSQMIPYSVFASQNPLPGSDNNNSLFIHPYTLGEDDYLDAKNDPAAPPTGTNADQDVVNTYQSKEASTVEFIVESVDEDTGAPDGNYRSEAGQTFTGLENGYYKVTPVDSNTDSRFRNAEAFFVQLPSGATGANNYDVHVYPKLTVNGDTTNDTTDPSTPSSSDPDKTDNKHAIKLIKELTDGAEWSSTTAAEFDIWYKDALGNWVDAGDFTTTDGVLIVDGLPLGTYYAVEKTAPRDYLLDQKPVVFVLDGSGDINKQVHTFRNDKELKVKKQIVTTGDDTGLVYKWKITADVPEKTENLISYSVTDTYTNLDVSPSDVSVTGLTSSQYTVTQDTDAGTLTITLNASGIAALTPATPLEIIVTSDIATRGTDVANSASITYQYAYTPVTTDDIPDDIPSIITPDPDDPTDPYPAPKEYPGTGTDPNTTDGFTPATITISNYAEGTTTELTNGGYTVTRCSPHNDPTTGEPVVTLADLAPGVYTITQNTTQAGYLIDNEAKNIFIAKDGTVYEGTAAVEGNQLANNKVIFYNKATKDGFQLPFTGTTATMVFTVTGIALMAGAAFFIFIIFKKRDEDEEEQEKA